ncbi:helix-turn-helix domain-containing protein [Roseibium sp. RKSG952]|uniref:helix-turn-helix domain-containing protein n=1 Tax=Roseibium sp. RKSG952 TaxID=2529384 RepID=UPI0012BCA256|nr:helix-turn-helix transcriptional regulator [Roseibium sp. RKSG952]MTH95838.1 XRE family transcriptional regulator [Roseibium sp. RKSG952]
MNNIREFRQQAGMSAAELAARTGFDIVELVMAERQWPLVRLSLVFSIASALDVSLGELFPTVGEILEGIKECDDLGDCREIALDDHNANALVSANIDPDPRDHFARFRFRSGNECHFRITSGVMIALKDTVANGEDPVIVFFADCKYVIVRRSSIKEITFPERISYPEFVSETHAGMLVIHTEDESKPEYFDTLPDGYGNNHVFGPLVESAAQGKPLLKFILMEGVDGEDRILSSAHIEALEIPMGLTDPTFYEEESESVLMNPEECDLADMATVGRA